MFICSKKKKKKKTSFPSVFYKKVVEKPFPEMFPKEAWVISLRNNFRENVSDLLRWDQLRVFLGDFLITGS